MNEAKLWLLKYKKDRKGLRELLKNMGYKEIRRDQWVPAAGDGSLTEKQPEATDEREGRS